MDHDIRSATAGKCPRCGMKLVELVRDPIEYPLHLTTEPQRVMAGDNVVLNLGIVDPKTQRPVRQFEVVHEKLYHVFVVSQDLKFFLHTHPERQSEGDFQLKMRFPKPGMYRLLSDFYPQDGTPQLIANTVTAAGQGFALEEARLDPDLRPQHSENADVALEIQMRNATAGQRAHLNFQVKPDDGIEPYLGTMGHMFAASSDLIDLIHSHPSQSTDEHRKTYKQLQFDVTFPRPGVYRVWIQFQRKGVVNTAAFNVPVAESR